MKYRLAFFAAFLACAAATFAQENAYDVLGKTLAPFVNLLAKNSPSPNRAMSLDLRVLAATQLPPALTGTAVSLKLEYPDKLLLHAPLLGEDVTIGRDGQELWGVPGSNLEARLKSAGLSKPEKKFQLADFELPIPEQQLVFLPALFQVTDAGSEMVNGESCRVLDIQLQPQLASALKVEAWTVRLWVRAHYQPAKIEFTAPQWHGVLSFDQIAFTPSLPAETWQPTPDQTDVLKLTPPHFKQLLDTAAGGSEP